MHKLTETRHGSILKPRFCVGGKAMRKRKTGISPVGIILIVLLVVAIFGVGIAALSNQQAYVREARITPTPSITPRTVLITENPAYPTSTPTPLVLQMNSVGIE